MQISRTRCHKCRASQFPWISKLFPRSQASKPSCMISLLKHGELEWVGIIGGSYLQGGMGNETSNKSFDSGFHGGSMKTLLRFGDCLNVWVWSRRPCVCSLLEFYVKVEYCIPGCSLGYKYSYKPRVCVLSKGCSGTGAKVLSYSGCHFPTDSRIDVLLDADQTRAARHAGLQGLKYIWRAFALPK